MRFDEIKTGDTLIIDCVDGDPIDGMDVSSGVRLQNFYADFSVSNVNATERSYTLTADTTGWPEGQLDWDIKYSINGVHVRSSTAKLPMVRGITK